MSVLDRFRLDRKRALVTGGTRGLGREMAVALAEAGAHVVIVARTAETLDETVQEILANDGTAYGVAADVADAPQWEKDVARIQAKHGPFDILVNNAGGRRIDTPTKSLSLGDWQRILDLNLTSAFVATRTVGADMIRRGAGGRIVNIASISGMIANRDIGGRAYEAAKAGLIHFTRATAADWAKHAVTVNAVCPGGFMTAANQRWAKESPEVIKTFRQQIPAGEFGEPADLGPLVVYLASDAARYVTGAALVIDGGYTVW